MKAETVEVYPVQGGVAINGEALLNGVAGVGMALEDFYEYVSAKLQGADKTINLETDDRFRRIAALIFQRDKALKAILCSHLLAAKMTHDMTHGEGPDIMGERPNRNNMN